MCRRRRKFRTKGRHMYSRQKRLIHQSIEKLDLDLSGLVVLTEAATGNYVFTPLICAAAGADRVLAVTRDSRYGSAREARSQTLAAASEMGLAGKVEVVEGPAGDLWGLGDIVTNLGFLRPIDAEAVRRLKTTAAVPVMFETWEFRPEDLDLGECWSRGICVLGTNEEHGAIKILDYLGMLVAKKLLDEGVEIYRSKLVVLGGGVFSRKVCGTLEGMGATVVRWPSDRGDRAESESEDRARALEGADAVVVADHPNSTTWVIGGGGILEPRSLLEKCPGALVAQLAGRVSRADIDAAGIRCIPELEPPHGHMGWSLSELGPKPVIDLHAGGLKVGELLAKARIAGLSPAAATRKALENPICQDFSLEQRRAYGRRF